MSSADARAGFLFLAGREVGGHLYLWGGESTDEGGFDCSGYVSTTLARAAKAWPALYDGRRRTAAGLYEYFVERGCQDIIELEELRPGCLAFYQSKTLAPIYHVAIHLATVPALETSAGPLPFGPVAFEAGGGGSATTSPRAALTSNAQIRLSATDRHGSARWVALDPFTLEGL